jgi:hypothetical protein
MKSLLGEWVQIVFFDTFQGITNVNARILFNFTPFSCRTVGSQGDQTLTGEGDRALFSRPELETRVRNLSVEQLEELGVALFDLSTEPEIWAWLERTS